MKLLTVVFAAMFAASVFADGVRYPIQDTYVSNVERDAGYGKIGWYLIGNGAEACVMFPVSGLANVTSAKFKFYVSQRGSDPSIKYPLYIRVMRDDRWHHDMLTWNALPDEFRFGYPSLLDVGKDPSIAGYIEVPGGEGGVFQEVDITKAVKDAAHSGRLALHIFTSWKPSGSDNLTLAMKSLECEDVSLRPCITFTGDVDTSDATMTVVASADTHIQSWSVGTNFGSANDAVMADKDGREAFVKFDLSGVKVDHVDSAMLLLYTYPSTYQPTLDDHVYTSDDGIQFQLTEKTNWDEMSLTWSNADVQTGCKPGLEKNYDWQSNVPANAVRGPSSATDKFYRIDVAKLVNQVLAVGGKTLSLRIIRNPKDSKRFFFFCPREYPNEAHRPRLLVTPKVDAALVARKPLHDTFVGTGSKDQSYFMWMLNRNPPWTYLQVGCSGDAVQYGLMLFDPAGLENAEFVRLRMQVKDKFPAGEGALRVTAWQSDRWNAVNLTWNTLSPWFPQPAAMTQDTVLDGEIASLKRTHSETTPYIELDVTKVIKEAAQAGKYVTFGLFSNAGTWPEIYRGESDHPAALLFPGIVEGFGKRVTCSLDLEGEKPALRLTWSPSASADATYTVERKDGENYETVACDLTSATCIDPDAEPWTDYSYRITESASSESVVKTVKLEAFTSIPACADTYVRSGNNKDARFGTEFDLTHRYDSGDVDGVREALYRFDIRDCSYDFKSATLKLYTAGDESSSHSGNEKFWVLTYPDFEWTDDTAPTWNSVFKNGYATPKALAGAEDGVRSEAYKVEVRNVTSSFGAGRLLEFDVSSIIRRAKAKGQTHVTFHTCAEDPDTGWNFDIISRERAQGVSWGPQIEFKLRSWIDRGFQIIIK